MIDKTTHEHIIGTTKECLFIKIANKLIKDKNFSYSKMTYYPFNNEKIKRLVDLLLSNNEIYPFLSNTEQYDYKDLTIIFDNGEKQFANIDIEYDILTIDVKGNRYFTKDRKYSKSCYFEMYKQDNTVYSYKMGKNIINHIIACFDDNRVLLVPAKMVELIANKKAGWLPLPRDFYSNRNFFRENLPNPKHDKKGVAIDFDILISCIPVFWENYMGKCDKVKYWISNDTYLYYDNYDDEFNGQDELSTLRKLLLAMKNQNIIEFAEKELE